MTTTNIFDAAASGAVLYGRTSGRTASGRTSAISLAAITAGAMAAAFILMSIGSLVTIISIGSSLTPGMQARASFTDGNIETGVVSVLSTDAGQVHAVKKSFKKDEKSYFMDAVLREESARTPAQAPEHAPQPVLPITKVNHIFADTMPRELSFHTVRA